MSEHFADRLARAIARTGTFACVGLDPVLDKLPDPLRHAPDPAVAIGDFSLGVIDAVAPLVPIVKLQAACYERYGAAGFAQLERTLAHARAQGLLVILDAKRGDIGLTAAHYAHMAFHHLHADALTVSPYLGPDTLEPFITPGKGLFVLVRTSNPGSDHIQSAMLRSGRTIAEHIADLLALRGAQPDARSACGLSNLGAVVGATKSADARAMRQAMPDQIFLVPGYGAQGGTADDIRHLLRQGQPTPQAGVLVTASRSVIYPGSMGGMTWTDNVRLAAQQLITELAQIHG
jgi:orotidine-5'-phosphate decarboxylase